MGFQKSRIWFRCDRKRWRQDLHGKTGRVETCCHRRLIGWERGGMERRESGFRGKLFPNPLHLLWGIKVSIRDVSTDIWAFREAQQPTKAHYALNFLQKLLNEKEEQEERERDRKNRQYVSSRPIRSRPIKSRPFQIPRETAPRNDLCFRFYILCWCKPKMVIKI